MSNENKSVVYAPMQPSRYDRDLELWVPTMNLDPAQRYGTLQVLLPPAAGRVAIGQITDVLRERLKNFSDRDYIVAVGDPSLIVATALIAAAKTGGKVNLLKWDRITSDYIAVEIKS